MSAITSARVSRSWLCCLCLLVWLDCGPAGPGRDEVTVRLDPGLSAKISDSEIGLAVITQDPNLIWCVVKLKPDYTGMNSLVERFLRAADSSAVMHSKLENKNRAVLDTPAPGRYWLLTMRLVAAGGERLLWSLPLMVDLSSTGGYELVLHRSNAALVLASGDSPI